MPLAAALVFVELVVAAEEVVDGALLTALTGPMIPPWTSSGSGALFTWAAAAWYSARVEDPSVGPLITPAMPSSQWLGKAQKNQIGFVSLIVIVNEFAFVPLVVVNRPLKKPWFTQGESNIDCVTECMGGEKMNSTLLPTAAVKLLGL